ncbi:ASCH domain-containing protein [Salmonella enterica subsp. enterica serovar Kokomlemle]
MLSMTQMKFHPRFADAFRSGQKTTSLRKMDFCCFPSRTGEDKFFHTDILTRDVTLHDYSSNSDIIFDAGTPYTRVSNLECLLKRQSHKPGELIALVVERDDDTPRAFAVAIIESISIIRGSQITDEIAVNDGFNPENNPRNELFAFLKDVYPQRDPLHEMYWLYTFTGVQMLSVQDGDA